jgi:protein-disulfide isomerase
MKRRYLLTAGTAAIAAGAGWLALRPQPGSTLLPMAAQAQDTTTEAPPVEGDATTTPDAAPDAAPTLEIVEMVEGNPMAKVEVIEYASFTCPHCAAFHADQYQQLKANYIDTNKIKFTYREIYFDRFGLWASMLARCGGPEKFFGIAEMLYAKQRDWLAGGDPTQIAANLRQIGKVAGMDDAALDVCMQDATLAQNLVAWFEENSTRDGINSTPSFMINGEKYSNMTYADFAAILDAKLAE